MGYRSYVFRSQLCYRVHGTSRCTYKIRARALCISGYPDPRWSPVRIQVGQCRLDSGRTAAAEVMISSTYVVAQIPIRLGVGPSEATIVAFRLPSRLLLPICIKLLRSQVTGLIATAPD